MTTKNKLKIQYWGIGWDDFGGEPLRKSVGKTEMIIVGDNKYLLSYSTHNQTRDSGTVSIKSFTNVK